MLTEVKCLLCKHLVRDDGEPFNHKCAAYPDGIPDEVFGDNRDAKDCKVDGYCFELIEKRVDG